MKGPVADSTEGYLALVRGAALVRGLHDVVWVRGPDTIGFLDGLLSQTVVDVRPGTVAPSLLLAPNGKLRALLWLLIGDDEVGIVSDAGTGEIVTSDLNRFRIRVDATIEQVDGDHLELWGPDAPGLLADMGHDAGDGWTRDPLVASLPFVASQLPRFMIPDDWEQQLTAAGAVRVHAETVTAVRIEAGEPVVGVDVDDSTIPQETGLVGDTVDFTKGCYLGQELVARIDSRGHVNRHLRGIVLQEARLPPTPSDVVVGDKVVGSMTSLGESLDLRAPVGLGLVRREVAPGDAVEIRWAGGSAEAIVRKLPLRSHAGSQPEGLA